MPSTRHIGRDRAPRPETRQWMVTIRGEAARLRPAAVTLPLRRRRQPSSIRWRCRSSRPNRALSRARCNTWPSSSRGARRRARQRHLRIGRDAVEWRRGRSVGSRQSSRAGRRSCMMPPPLASSDPRCRSRSGFCARVSPRSGARWQSAHDVGSSSAIADKSDTAVPPQARQQPPSGHDGCPGETAAALVALATTARSSCTRGVGDSRVRQVFGSAACGRCFLRELREHGPCISPTDRDSPGEGRVGCASRGCARSRRSKRLRWRAPTARYIALRSPDGAARVLRRRQAAADRPTGRRTGVDLRRAGGIGFSEHGEPTGKPVVDRRRAIFSVAASGGVPAAIIVDRRGRGAADLAGLSPDGAFSPPAPSRWQRSSDDR